LVGVCSQAHPCLSNTRRDGKALERFLEDYFDGNLKRYLKSEPIPESNDGPVKVRGSQGPQTPTQLPLLTFLFPKCWV